MPTIALLQSTIRSKAGSMLMYCDFFITVVTRGYFPPTYIMMGRYLPSTVSPLLSETSSVDYIAIKIGTISRKI